MLQCLSDSRAHSIARGRVDRRGQGRIIVRIYDQDRVVFGIDSTGDQSVVETINSHSRCQYSIYRVRDIVRYAVATDPLSLST